MPIFLKVVEKYGQVVIVTKHGHAMLIDLITSKLLYKSKISDSEVIDVINDIENHDLKFVNLEG